MVGDPDVSNRILAGNSTSSDHSLPWSVVPLTVLVFQVNLWRLSFEELMHTGKYAVLEVKSLNPDIWANFDTLIDKKILVMETRSNVLVVLLISEVLAFWHVTLKYPLWSVSVVSHDTTLVTSIFFPLCYYLIETVNFNNSFEDRISRDWYIEIGVNCKLA